MKVILDTNFIISCLRQKIQIFDEGYILIVPEEVISELRSISRDKESKVKDRQVVELALELINKNEVERVKLNLSEGEDVDSGLIKLAKKKGSVVASLDKKLREGFKEGRFLIIKGKKKLVFV